MIVKKDWPQRDHHILRERDAARRQKLLELERENRELLEVLGLYRATHPCNRPRKCRSDMKAREALVVTKEPE